MDLQENLFIHAGILSPQQSSPCGADRKPRKTPAKTAEKYCSPQKYPGVVLTDWHTRGLLYGGTDERTCWLCSVKGDQVAEKGGRLLPFDACRWIHVQCARWSTGCRDRNGRLLNLRGIAVSCIASLCAICGETRASLSCTTQRCKSKAHFSCAVRRGWGFAESGTVCQQHNTVTACSEINVASLLCRFVCCPLRMLQRVAPGCFVRSGNTVVVQLGEILEDDFFHDHDFIYPDKFMAQRSYHAISPNGSVHRTAYQVREDSQPRLHLNFIRTQST